MPTRLLSDSGPVYATCSTSGTGAALIIEIDSVSAVHQYSRSVPGCTLNQEGRERQGQSQVE